MRIGSNVLTASLDQKRVSLEPTVTLVNALTGGGSDTLTINNERRHVVGYMKDFLFAPEQALTPIGKLSGGERGRLMLARALATPSNLMVLDEPTNDLDIETLDLLQELLGDYAGTILIVSHDRDFLDRVATSVVVAEGGGRWVEYAGGYSDMVAQRGSGLAGPLTLPPKRRKGRKSGRSSGPRRGASSPLTRSARSRRFRSASMSCAGTSRRWSASSRTPTLPRVSLPSFSMRQRITRNSAKRSPAPRTTGSASKSCVRSSNDSRGGRPQARLRRSARGLFLSARPRRRHSEVSLEPFTSAMISRRLHRPWACRAARPAGGCFAPDWRVAVTAAGVTASPRSLKALDFVNRLVYNLSTDGNWNKKK